jgi:hypothetical protein
LQAELNKVVVEDGGVESGIQTDAKKTNQRATTNNSKHHSLLLQVKINFWSISSLMFLGMLVGNCFIFLSLFLAACKSDWL